jgi:DNA-binding NtrC family response regulator
MEQRDSIPKRLILVVDDDPLVRRSMQRVLGGEYEVLPAGGKAEAEAILESRGDICLVISDCQMEQGRSGIELLQALKSGRPGIGRILVSGSLEAREAQALVENRTAHLYLPKPWNKDTLLEALRGYFAAPPRD